MGCNSTDSCRTSLCNVQNVAEQNRLDLASLSQRRKAVDTANQTTLNILKNLLNVDSNIVDIDKTVQKLNQFNLLFKCFQHFVNDVRNLSFKEKPNY